MTITLILAMSEDTRLFRIQTTLESLQQLAHQIQLEPPTDEIEALNFLDLLLRLKGIEFRRLYLQ